MNLPTLYHLSKTDKIIQWTVSVDGSTIITEYGELDGKLQTTSKEVTEKNVGKSNATSLEEQAIKEARAMWKKKLDSKYSVEIPEKTLRISPMLAQDFYKNEHNIEYPIFIQPKLNGVRCLAYWQDDQIKLYSRGNKEYTGLTHITSILEKILPKDYILDGELYIHDTKLQDIISYVKKIQDKSSLIQYHIYDCVDKNNLQAVYHDRFSILVHTIEDSINEKEEKTIQLVSTVISFFAEQLPDIVNKYIDNGYEGAMVRSYSGKYEFGYRSKHLLKVKKFQDAEFKVVGHNTGVGKFADCVIWICEQEEGKQFNVVPVGTLEEKMEWAKNAKQYYGKQLTVKFFDRSKDNIPTFPVGIVFRDYE
jgi:DNA ligase-1